MTFIHLNKSIVTFHFKEILEDGHLGGPLTLVGLGALLVGPKLLSNLTSTTTTTPSKGKTTFPYRPGMSLSEWVAHAKQRQEQASQSTMQPTSLTDRTQQQSRRVA
ncbi:MAG: hypothetical protein AAFY26_14580 [Cyanobacteria bacterium J06638_22]